MFEVAVDYSETSHCWKEMLRVWIVTLSHSTYEAELPKILASYKKSSQIKEKQQLWVISS